MHTAPKSVRPILILFYALLAVVFSAPAVANRNTVLVLGDSISAAYGVPSETAWVRLLSDRLADNGLSSWQVVNASISGETTDGGARRLPALIEEHNPGVVIIELGGNDGLRGFPPNIIENNLADMISRVQKSGAEAILVGMQIPPNYGRRYTAMFADIYPKLSDRYGTELVPFFLEGIYDQDGLMQEDGIHPTAEAQIKLLDNVWPVLEPVLH